DPGIAIAPGTALLRVLPAVGAASCRDPGIAIAPGTALLRVSPAVGMAQIHTIRCDQYHNKQASLVV
ncbi:MAG TPA: hypothetical protein PKK10_18550, partial [Woeseiaceae bacterium]|nr:hypothetical protein [Woeseiaceae bacterium]